MNTKSKPFLFILFLLFALISCNINTADKSQAPPPVANYLFDGNTDDFLSSTFSMKVDGDINFKDGIQNKAIELANTKIQVESPELTFNGKDNFSVQFWVKSSMSDSQKAFMLGSKQIQDNSLWSQKKAGWFFGTSKGTFNWNIGSGDRRITYERDNGDKMPLNDGKWHQLTMTYSSLKNEARIYYDGMNKAIYKVHDDRGFDFTSLSPLTIGWKNENKQDQEIVTEIKEGAVLLQNYVAEFNKIGLERIKSDQFKDLVVNQENSSRLCLGV